MPADHFQTRLISRRLRDAPRAAHPRVHEQRRRRRVVLSESEQLPVCGGGGCAERIQLRPRVPASRRVGLPERGRGADSVLVPLRRGSRAFRGVSTQRSCFCCLNDAGVGCKTTQRFDVRDRTDKVERTRCVDRWFVQFQYIVVP